MQKNTAGKWVVFAWTTADNLPKTGDAAQITANIRIDGAAANAVDDTNPTELEDGYYVFDITATEANGDNLVLCPASSTSGVQVIGVPGAVWTRPPNFQSLSITAGGVAKSDVDTIKTQTVTAAAGVTFPTSIASPTNITAGTITTVTNLTNLPAITAGWLTATGIAADAITAAKLASDVTTELQAGLATASALAVVAGYLDTEIAAILAAVDTEVATLTSELAKIPKSDGTATWNATALGSLQTEASDAITAAALATAANLATLTAYVDTEVAAILADTNELQTDWANGGRLDLILDAASAPSAAAVADAVWDEALAGHAGAGSAGEALSSAGTAGDPWTTALPGAYGAGTAGSIVGALPDVTAGAEGGVFIAGTNAPVTITGDGTALTLLSTGSNGHGLLAQGNGSGSGLTGSGGATGNGFYAAGDGTGNGILATGGDGTLSVGILATSNASITPFGLYVESGTVLTNDGGPGLRVSATGGNANGLEAEGIGTGDGIATIAGASGVGLSGTVEAVGVAGAGLTALGDTRIANLNATVSSRSSHSAADVWAVATRSLTTFGSLVSDIWASATRTLTAISDSSGVTTLLSRIIGTLATGTHNPQSGDAYAVVNSGTYGNAAIKTETASVKAKTDQLTFTTPGSVDASATVDEAALGAAVWDVAIGDHLDAGSTGAALNAAGSAGDPWTTPLPGAYGAGTAGNLIGTYLDVPLSDAVTAAEGPGDYVTAFTYRADPNDTQIATVTWSTGAVWTYNYNGTNQLTSITES